MAEQYVLKNMSEQYKKRLRSSENADGSRGKKSSIVALACSPVATVAPASVAAPSPVAMAKPAATVAVTTPPGFMPPAPSPAATREIVAPSSAATTKPAATVVATSPVAVMAPAPVTPSSAAIAKPAATVAIARTVTVVKLEDQGTQAAEQEDGATVAVVAEEGEPVNLDLPKKLFHCTCCRAPLKPPVFKCEKEHFVCHACGDGDKDGGAKKHCSPCGRDVSYTRSNFMDGVVDVVDDVPCPYRSFGCARYMAYHSATEHMARCEHAPCYCLECRFKGSPANLLRHLTAPSGEHSWPVEKIKYETRYQFTVPASAECQRRLLVAEDDCMFLLAVDAGREPAGSRSVHVVCVRGNADADATPLYTGVLWVDGPPAAPGQLLRGSFQLKATVESCSVPGAVDMEQGWLYAHVNPTMLHGESGEVHLRLCLTKFPEN